VAMGKGKLGEISQGGVASLTTGNVVAVHRARLLQGWVTVSQYISWCVEIYL